MYGVPKDIDLTPFLGARLELIEIGFNKIGFIFSRPEGTTPESLAPIIDVEGPWEYRGANGEVIDQRPAGDLGPYKPDVIRVHRAISHTVVSVAANPPDSITIGFEDSTSLVVFEGHDGYESFQVSPGGYLI